MDANVLKVEIHNHSDLRTTNYKQLESTLDISQIKSLSQVTDGANYASKRTLQSDGHVSPELGLANGKARNGQTRSHSASHGMSDHLMDSFGRVGERAGSFVSS